MAKKAAKQSTAKVPNELLDELLRIGNLMSNVCYNLAQPSAALDTSTRVMMDGLRQQWDAALTKLRDQQKGIKR